MPEPRTPINIELATVAPPIAAVAATLGDTASMPVRPAGFMQPHMLQVVLFPKMTLKHTGQFQSLVKVGAKFAAIPPIFVGSWSISFEVLAESGFGIPHFLQVRFRLN